MGKLFRDHDGRVQGHCSGTLIARGVIITAAHCMYAKSNEATEYGFEGYIIEHQNIWFAADESFSSDQGSDVTSAYAPYNWLRVVHAWVPQCWADGDGACDYGIAEVEPYSNGSYVGEYTGTFPLLWQYGVTDGQVFYLMGYPASWAFSTSQAHYGDEPYYCSDNYDGNLITAQLVPSLASLVGSGIYLAAKGCEMTGGFSGGPVFTQFSDGNWYIAGTDDIWGQDRNRGVATYNGWPYWTSNFGAFLCGVVPGICS